MAVRRNVLRRRGRRLRNGDPHPRSSARVRPAITGKLTDDRVKRQSTGSAVQLSIRKEIWLCSYASFEIRLFRGELRPASFGSWFAARNAISSQPKSPVLAGISMGAGVVWRKCGQHGRMRWAFCSFAAIPFAPLRPFRLMRCPARPYRCILLQMIHSPPLRV